MKVSLLASFLLLYTLMPVSSFAQGEQKPMSYRVYDSSARQVTLDDLLKSMSKVEVVFIGESHNDAVAHQIEAQLLEAAATLYAKNGSADLRRPVILSMEMFERDVQTPLDEYLGGLILERQFLSDSRPWSNYQSDYRPLVEFARANNLPVVAANAPARYVNRVARLGRESLEALSPQAKEWLAPLPYGAASAAYAEKFTSFMKTAMAGHDTASMQTLLDAQVLRDATMAYSIAQSLKREKKALVLHVTGIFHVEGRLGTAEQLQAYRPRTRSLVVAIIPASENRGLESLKKVGDFVFITEGAKQ